MTLYHEKVPVEKEEGIPIPHTYKERAAVVAERIVTEIDKPVNQIVREVSEELNLPLAEEGNSVNVTTSRIRKRPDVLAILNKHAEKAESNLLEIADYSTQLGKSGDKSGAAYAAVAVSANDKILDRIHGKARQQIDVTNQSVSLNIDLTSSLTE